MKKRKNRDLSVALDALKSKAKAKRSFVLTMADCYAEQVDTNVDEVWHDIYARLMYDYGIDVRKIFNPSKHVELMDALEEYNLLEFVNNVIRDKMGAFIMKPYEKDVRVNCPF